MTFMALPQPTPTQRNQGHAVVGIAFAIYCNVKLKAHPVIAVIAGFFAAGVHEMFDAPVSKGIAAIEAQT